MAVFCSWLDRNDTRCEYNQPPDRLFTQALPVDDATCFWLWVARALRRLWRR